MPTQRETLFVTGANGFVGKNILEHFNEKYRIVAPSHSELDLLSQKDVQNFFRINHVDYVINCATVGANRKNPIVPNTVENNLRMFFNICENAHFFKKMIHFGSGAEYNKDRMSPMVMEDAFGKFLPQDEYGFSKYAISKYIEESKNAYCLRLFGIFGRYEDYEFKFISNAIVKNLLHMPITIVQNAFFDWLYIEDLMNILDFFLKNAPPYRCYNTTTGKTIDLITIAKLINKNSEYESEIMVQNENLNREYSGSNHRLLSIIGEHEFTDIELAIKKLQQFYKENLTKINRTFIEKDPYIKNCKILETQ